MLAATCPSFQGRLLMVERLKGIDWPTWALVAIAAIVPALDLAHSQFASATPTATSLVELRADISTLTSEVADLRARIGTLPGPGEIADLSRRVGSLESDDRHLQENNSQMAAMLAQVQQQVADMVAASKVPLRR
ncbi:MAG: hypothetical protein ACLGP3_05615 [Acidobacteriota bacterium]